MIIRHCHVSELHTILAGRKHNKLAQKKKNQQQQKSQQKKSQSQPQQKAKKGGGQEARQGDKKSSRDLAKEMIRVTSSNVYGYSIDVPNSKSGVGNVYVQFKNKHGGPGDIYVYYSVPMQLFRKWITAPSKGKFVWKYLRFGFMYSKLTGNKRGVLPNAVN